MLDWVAFAILLEAAIMANIVASCKIWHNAQVTRFFLGHGGSKMIAVAATKAYNKVVGGIEDDKAIMISLEA